MNFEELGFQAAVVDALQAENITVPTKVQEMAIPRILAGKDVVMQSETGSGKTLAYLLPLYAKQGADATATDSAASDSAESDAAAIGLQMLVLVPTRELAMQVHHQVERLSKNADSGIKSVPIFADVSIKSQIEKLKAKPQIVVGTATRILELIKQKKITAHTVKTIVIDEADKLLDENNIEEVKAVVKCCLRDTQLVLCSASIVKDTMKQAELLAKQPEVIKTTEKAAVPETIEHLYVVSGARDKIEVLHDLIRILKPKRAFIFINGAEDIDKALIKLQAHNLPVCCIRGTNTKQERQKALADFSSGKIPYLVASDLAARGLHIEGVTAIFHITIPEDPLDYLHRVGRTGRGDAHGLSVTIVTQKERVMIAQFEKALSIHMVQKQISDSKHKIFTVERQE